MMLQDLKRQDLATLEDLRPEKWPDLVPSFKFYLDYKHCHPFKVLADDKIVGLGCTIIHDEVAWLAHIIVHPEHRNKGIGKHITEGLIENAKRKNCETIYLIATELGAYVYEKLNFVTETEYLFHKAPDNRPTFSLCEKIIPYHRKWKDEILKLDCHVSSEDRLSTIEDHLNEAKLYVEHNTLVGFFLPSLGDGLVIAANQTAGIELLKVRLNTKDILIFPSENRSALSFVEQNNYPEVYRAKRMILGNKRTLNLSKLYNRIGGNLG